MFLFHLFERNFSPREKGKDTLRKTLMTAICAESFHAPVCGTLFNAPKLAICALEGFLLTPIRSFRAFSSSVKGPLGSVGARKFNS